MQITEEFLQQRLSELAGQREEALMQLGAVNGAIQFCKHLIGKLGEEDMPPAGESDGLDTTR